MNKDIEKILKYQSVDMDLYKVDKKLKNAEVTKKFMEANAMGKQLTSDLNNIDREIQSEMTSINKANEDFASLLEEINDLENSIGDNANIEQIDYFLKKIDDLQKKVSDLENIISDSRKTLEKLNDGAESAMVQLKKCGQIMLKYKPEFEKLKNELSKEAKDIKARLQEVAKAEGITEEAWSTNPVFKVYREIRKRKMPVFVELSGNNCDGCGLEVPESVFNAVKEKGFGECPTCGRKIYMKD